MRCFILPFLYVVLSPLCTVSKSLFCGLVKVTLVGGSDFDDDLQAKMTVLTGEVASVGTRLRISKAGDFSTIHKIGGIYFSSKISSLCLQFESWAQFAYFYFSKPIIMLTSADYSALMSWTRPIHRIMVLLQTHCRNVETTLFIPFFFSKEPSCYLPLCALSHSQIEVEIQFKAKDKCVINSYNTD